MAPTNYRREKVEKFAETLRNRKDFYAKKSQEYLPVPGNTTVSSMKLWKENKVKSDIYDEILADLLRHFELDQPE
ncbi:UNVERIFIED_CONTAM: hypothetical protein ABIC26_005255 [Paenibacillus sp. PvR008]